MGVWGPGTRQNDFALDVIGHFEDLLKAGNNVADVTNTVKAKFANEITDTDDGPLFWIALADVQWTYGGLDPEVFERVHKDLHSGKALDSWREDPRGFARRKATLERFLSKIAVPNPRPKKPRVVVRAPKFQAGDCLSIGMENSQYAAALVLAADHSKVEYGQNLIGMLDYLSHAEPEMEVFRERKWLVRTHHQWNNEMDIAWYQYPGFRSAKKRIRVVGQVHILPSDPKDSRWYSGWAGLGEQVVYQREWDAKRI